VRLLYVAVTRARQRLYLSGHAPWRDSEAGPVPASRSLLHLLWPAVRQHYAGITAAGESAVEREETSLESTWLRLPADFVAQNEPSLPTVQTLSRSAAEAAAEPEFSWVGPLARAAGTVMHAEFERLAAAPEYVLGIEARQEACAARLREQGIAPAQALQTAQSIVRQLSKLATDERVQWLVSGSHRDAHSELRLSGIVDGELRNVVIDRSFVDASGTRWIIDYKTSLHAGGGLEEFLAREMERYAPQLRLYLRLAGALGPEPVRAALYFPWLREFRALDPST
jgi:ATP-dependent helicase/nuclease subunit A